MTPNNPEQIFVECKNLLHLNRWRSPGGKMYCEKCIKDDRSKPCKGCNHEAEYKEPWHWHTCGKTCDGCKHCPKPDMLSTCQKHVKTVHVQPEPKLCKGCLSESRTGKPLSFGYHICDKGFPVHARDIKGIPGYQNAVDVPMPTKPSWEEEYPLNTFTGETKRGLVDFISRVEKEAEERGRAEGRLEVSDDFHRCNIANVENQKAQLIFVQDKARAAALEEAVEALYKVDLSKTSMHIRVGYTEAVQVVKSLLPKP